PRRRPSTLITTNNGPIGRRLGAIYAEEDGLSPIVELSSRDDLYMLLNAYPADGEFNAVSVLDGWMIDIGYVSVLGGKRVRALNPDFGGFVARDLYAAFKYAETALKVLVDLVGSTHVLPAISAEMLHARYQSGWSVDLTTRTEFAALFGKSGLFGFDARAHNIEMIIVVEEPRYDRHYRFILTPTSLYSAVVDKKHTFVSVLLSLPNIPFRRLQLPRPDVDWLALLDDVKDRRQAGVMAGAEGIEVASKKLSDRLNRRDPHTISVYLQQQVHHYDFALGDRSEMPAMWDVLYPVMDLLEDQSHH
ncbi:MAG: hypothetical protein AAF125_23605, partial [Chloroflexota bacterium]